MNKLAPVFLALCLCLSGCGQNIPAAAADGAPWDESWVSVGGILGVDTPEGLDPRENSGALAASGMYYATWSAGEAVPYTNEDGESAELYDAQVYLLLAGYSAAGRAEETAAEWLAMASERYDVQGISMETYNGQTFTVAVYTLRSETNPYARGASAFGVYRNYAISAELTCRAGFEGEPQAILASFLESWHYAA